MAAHEGLEWAGELCQVWQHTQPGVDLPQTFVEVGYFVCLEKKPLWLAQLYTHLPELEVHFWEYDRYQHADDLSAYPLTHVDKIAGAAARCMMELDSCKTWITTGMSKCGHSV
ncbi:hypothetical protein DACRYDRAFT_115722 [Dacryopinax primogenitus]|uniref:Uncharacterized protein n=1 Tax=Dacryopinax primogenitus (strain DJM 731) TaxID=1858805 RepID=M5GDV7_DACPD|nr:uncharacterized protein DACRYDRAFT_115722 [Dacryopinax primogenitus]EJU02723.1 hypothetical protein DACRYDRAFT_115722 [Dacryopinax primogenitus]